MTCSVAVQHWFTEQVRVGEKGKDGGAWNFRAAVEMVDDSLPDEWYQPAGLRVCPEQPRQHRCPVSGRQPLRGIDEPVGLSGRGRCDRDERRHALSLVGEALDGLDDRSDVLLVEGSWQELKEFGLRAVVREVVHRSKSRRQMLVLDVGEHRLEGPDPSPFIESDDALEQAGHELWRKQVGHLLDDVGASVAVRRAWRQ